jgi:hypothetical protein
MSDYLSAADWKRELKSHPDAKEAADLTKLFDEYAKSKASPAKQLVALKAVSTQAQALKSKFAKDKSLAAYLGDVIDAAAEAREEAEAEAKAEEQAGASPEDVSFDPELVKHLLVVRNIGLDKARYFVLALGKPSGMAISKVPIAKKHKDQAKKWRVGKGKLLEGRCYGEGGKYIFEFEDKPQGGLAKNIKKAVKNQAEKEIKLKVRGGGLDVDDDADDEEVEDFGEEAAEIPEAPPLSTTQSTTEDVAAKTSEQPKARSQESAEYQARLKPLLEKLKDALLAKAPNAQTAKLRLSESQTLFRGKDFAGATALLDDIETLLAKPTDADGATTSDTTVRAEKATDENVSRGPSRVVLEQSRRAWDGARNKAQAEIGALQKSMFAKCRTKDDFKTIRQAARSLDSIVKSLDGRLSAKLLEAMDASSAEDRQRLQKEANAILSEYLTFVSGDPLVRDIDTNPFHSVNVRGSLSKTLTLLKTKLGS